MEAKIIWKALSYVHYIENLMIHPPIPRISEDRNCSTYLQLTTEEEHNIASSFFVVTEHHWQGLSQGHFTAKRAIQTPAGGNIMLVVHMTHPNFGEEWFIGWIVQFSSVSPWNGDRTELYCSPNNFDLSAKWLKFELDKISCYRDEIAID